MPNVILPDDKVPWYEIDGHRYVRVTHPLEWWTPPELKRYFINNSAKAIEKKKTETAAQGTEIHNKAENGTEDRLKVLLAEKGIEVLQNEIVVWSKNGWAGRADMIFRMNGKKYLADIKTGRHGAAFFQLGAYSLAANELGYGVEGVGVIGLPRDGISPAGWFDYSAHFEEGQIQYCMLYDCWRRSNYKQLVGWEFAEGYATFSYNWNPEIIYQNRTVLKENGIVVSFPERKIA